MFKPFRELLRINEANFLLSCIPGTTPGKLPENWELPLQFAAASTDMKALPVVDVTSSGPNTSPSAITLEQVIETNDGYILIGKFRLIGYPLNVVPNGFQWDRIKFTDANRKIIESHPASGVQFENKFDGEIAWAYEIKGKHHALPLTIRVEAVQVYILDETAEFEFDTGSNPLVGQTWTPNQDVQIAGYDIREIFIKRTSTGYEFQFKVDPDLLLFVPEIKGFPSSQGGGGGDGFGRGEIYYHLEYKGELPSGELTVKLSDVWATIHGPWQVQWSPDNVLPVP